MTVLVTRNPTLFADIGWTPALDGAEPVAIGTLLVEAGENPRYAAIHNFLKITEEWIEAYCSGDSPAMVILKGNELPADWNYPTEP